MEKSQFHQIVQQTFDMLPERFKDVIENLWVDVEDYPSDELVWKLRLPSKHHLLGLYQGVPLTARGTWYGMMPVIPDKISLYQKNIEAQCQTEEEIAEKIYEVLVHEIGHYFGMSDAEIRAAGY